MKQLSFGWLYPDVFSLHGEQGNVMAFMHLAKLHDIDLTVTRINFGDEWDPLDFDILYLGAGEVAAFSRACADLSPKKDDLQAFMDSGKVLLVTGNSLSLFGKEIRRQSGEVLPMLGLFKLKAQERPDVYGDDLWVRLHYHGKDMELFGSQIHMVNIDSEEDALGEILYGYGNNEEQVKEGILYKNSIFTHILGPLCILNPWLTLEILSISSKKTLSQDFPMEKASLQAKRAFTKQKKSLLKNRT